MNSDSGLNLRLFSEHRLLAYPLAAMENALRLNGEIEVKHYQQGVGLTNQYNYFAKTFIRLESRVGLANLFQLVDSINYWSDRVILQ